MFYFHMCGCIYGVEQSSDISVCAVMCGGVIVIFGGEDGFVCYSGELMVF